MKSRTTHHTFLIIVLVLQILFAVVFTSHGEIASVSEIWYVFNLFAIGIMLLLGFGFLMTFLENYGIGSVGFCYILSAVATELFLVTRWIVVMIFESDSTHDIVVSPYTLIEGFFAAAAVLITFGALIGRVSFSQLIVIVIIEIFFFPLNVYLCEEKLHLADRGGSYLVHMYGAGFGLTVSFFIGIFNKKTKSISEELNRATYISDLFSYIGTTLLWVFWPQFVSGLATSTSEISTIVSNCYLALIGSTVTVFSVSGLIRRDLGRFNNVDIVNATLAGGVAIGSLCNASMRPGIALFIGILAGIYSCFGFAKVSPFLEEKCGLKDVCGVLNLHFVPGLIGALSSIIFRAVSDNTSIAINSGIPVHDYTIGNQTAALFVTLGLALLAGFLAASAASYVDVVSVGYDDSLFFSKEAEVEESEDEESEAPLDEEDSVEVRID